jgi:hypothetical protein
MFTPLLAAFAGIGSWFEFRSNRRETDGSMTSSHVLDNRDARFRRNF